MKIFATLLSMLPATAVAFVPTPAYRIGPSTPMAAVTENAVLDTADAASPPAVAPAAETEKKTEKRSMFDDDFLDEAALLAAAAFPLSPDALLERARYVLGPKCGIGTKDGAACLADDFEFCAAVVGPIPRDEYIAALEGFNLEDSFDITSNYFGLTVDPLQPNRVWFMNRVRGIHTGTFLGAKPDGKEIVYPPQILHMDFNADGKVREFGFYTADRRQGTTGGLGGAFGFMYGVGRPLPIPECQPFKRSKRFRLLNFVGNLASKFQKK